MRSFTFRWAHPAESVYVTGTFDNWARTERLNRRADDVFEKTVILPESKDKILYKFVADGVWKHDHTAKTESDHEGNVNNVLYPEDVYDHSAPQASTISSVAPGASTVAMAGEQPLEKKEASVDAPGAFPVTPDQNFSVNPIAASAGAGNPIHLAPGEKVPDSSTFNSNTVASTVHDDPTLKSGEQTFGVAPIPATGGAGNPIHLQPGEKVPDPSTITGNTVESTVRDGPAAYAQSDAQAPTTAPHGHGTEIAAGAAGVAGAGALGAAAAAGLGNKDKGVIPESSLGMGKDVPPPITDNISSVGPSSTTAQLAGQVPLEPRPDATISSVAPAATTVGLAGQVPKEPRADAAASAGTQPAAAVPQEVAESQQKAHVGPEASANPGAVSDKAALEKELQNKVPEAAVTSDEAHKEGKSGIGGAAVAGAATAGAAALGAAAFASTKIHEKTGKDPTTVLPESVQQKINEQNNASNAGGLSSSAAPAVPAVVSESQQTAHAAPEASANREAVLEKDAVERELKAKVPETEAGGQPAPTTAAATSATAPAATAAAVSATGAPQLANPVAGVSPISMDDKLNAPAGAAAQTPAQKAAQLAAAKPSNQPSRDVSPMSKPAGTQGQTQPAVTTGVASGTAPSQSTPIGTPRNGNRSNSNSGKRSSMLDRLRNNTDEAPGKSGEAGTAASDKKGKRRSLLGRIKDKLSSK